METEEIYDLDEITSSEIFRQLHALNLINETELRNLRIRNEYRALRKKFSASYSLDQLMRKYFLSDAAVHSILFRKDS